MLAATGAYRAGAGLVTIAAGRARMPALAAGIPEATFIPLDDVDGGIATPSVLVMRNEWKNFRTAVIGPGMGDTEATAAFTWAAFDDMAHDIAGGIVVDADALNALARMSDGPERVPANAVLTPHPGEMARLLGSTVEDVQAGRLQAAQQRATKFGCTVVLKGAHTVVAAADGRSALSPFANPLMATAGAGDVLAGIIAGYLAQGLEPFIAAATRCLCSRGCGRGAARGDGRGRLACERTRHAITPRGPGDTASLMLYCAPSYTVIGDSRVSRRVVVTGIGMVTPVGHNSRDSWAALTAGEAGVGPITLFDPAG